MRVEIPEKYVATIDFLDWSASAGGERIEATLYYMGKPYEIRKNLL